MIKKILTILLVLLFLTGCTNKLTINDDQIAVRFDFSQFEGSVMTITFDYGGKEDLWGLVQSCRADEKPFSSKEVITQIFEKEDFPEGESLDNCWISMCISEILKTDFLLNREGSIECDSPLDISLQWGKVYNVNVVGDYQSFTLELVNE